MTRYKQVKVDCFKTGQNLVSEIFENITEKQLEKELNKMVKAGWDKFVIEKSNMCGKKAVKILVLAKERLKFNGSELNSRDFNTGSKEKT